MDNLVLFFNDDQIDVNLVGHLAENLAQPLQNNLQIGERVVKTRNQNYFEYVVPRYSDIQFQEHFRMPREKAEELAHIIGVHLEDPNYLAPLRKKVLFSVWLLSKPESFLAASDRFGFATSTGHYIFKKIITTISRMLPQYIQWPNQENYLVSSQIFRERSNGFPGIMGAIDGCHIPMKQPVGNSVDFYNRKGFHSIILQGVCDHTGKFIDCFIGMPGRMHDGRVFRNSPLYQRILNNENPLIPPNFNLIGDAAYPLMECLMTPFRDTGHLTPAQTLYNIRLSSVRSIIERAFGRLKGKFRRLKYLDIMGLELGNHIIAAACVLHNFTINIEIEDIELNEVIENVQEERDVPQFLEGAAVQKRNRIVRLFQ